MQTNLVSEWTLVGHIRHGIGNLQKLGQLECRSRYARMGAQYRFVDDHCKGELVHHIDQSGEQMNARLWAVLERALGHQISANMIGCFVDASQQEHLVRCGQFESEKVAKDFNVETGQRARCARHTSRARPTHVVAQKDEIVGQNGHTLPEQSFQSEQTIGIAAQIAKHDGRCIDLDHLLFTRKQFIGMVAQVLDVLGKVNVVLEHGWLWVSIFVLVHPEVHVSSDVQECGAYGSNAEDDLGRVARTCHGSVLLVVETDWTKETKSIF